MLSIWQFLLVALAATLAGMANALAGGGTLITFPMLTAVGISTLGANVTNTMALCPGYLGATLAQTNDLRGQKLRLWLFVPAGLLGGIVGGVLLLNTGERAFRALVPFLILSASGLLAIQESVRAWVMRRSSQTGAKLVSEKWGVLPVGLAAVYGGYFGAGLSVIVLAMLGITQNDSLTRLNALKQVVSLSTNIAAAVFFLFSGQVVWSATLVMAVAALIGGVLGGKLAGRIKPSTLRWTVVAIGVIVAAIYWLR